MRSALTSRQSRGAVIVDLADGHEVAAAVSGSAVRREGRHASAGSEDVPRSGIDRDARIIAIKPSGVDYATLHPEDIVVVSLDDGRVVEGDGRPSSDTPTHLVLYRSFPELGGVVHTHSVHASAWAQARREIPGLGTTHADHFHGPVPVTRWLTDAEIQADYEAHTGRVIVERFTEAGIDPTAVPACLDAGHGPFTWGETPHEALVNAIVLEQVARQAIHTLAIEPGTGPIPGALLDKHFQRKHGPAAYYGQPRSGSEAPAGG